MAFRRQGITAFLCRSNERGRFRPLSLMRLYNEFILRPSIVVLLASVVSLAAADPIRLHPDNPHYFLFRGKPTILISSGEHYGAVLNQDFDFLAYLDTLQAEGMNLTRAVPGT